MICKRADLMAMQSLNMKTARLVSNSASLLDAVQTKGISGPYADLLVAAVKAWVGASKSSSQASTRLSQVENAIMRSISKQTIKYESKMTVLGTIISGGPFLGLLGTAWGVMDCFGSMSGHTSVTLQQLAPGVAGALLTTVAGLLVAIPSVFGYNYLTTIEANMTVELENFATLVSDKIELESSLSESAINAGAPVVNSAVSAPVNAVPQQQVAPVPTSTPVVQTTPTPTREQAHSSAPRIIDFSLDDDDDS